MNLKESFRYQKFLESLMHSAGMSIQQRPLSQDYKDAYEK